jgi:hypothetical protein
MTDQHARAPRGAARGLAQNNKIRRQIDENAEKPTPTDVLGDE